MNIQFGIKSVFVFRTGVYLLCMCIFESNASTSTVDKYENEITNSVVKNDNTWQWMLVCTCVCVYMLRGALRAVT